MTFDGNSKLRLGYSLALPLVVSMALLGGRSASAYTPEDPVVRQMVERGLGYLETVDWKKFGAPEDGELILMAYTHYKVKHDPGNAVVKTGLAAAQKIVQQASGGNKAHKYNYDAAVAVLLLASLDPNAYQTELRTLQQYLFDVQAAHGGWTYPAEHDGDVSQTQYALLAIWTLDRVGIKLDYRKVAAAAEFLVRVQDESGPWPYHAKIPTGNTLIRQPKTGYSMAIAGGSSVLIAGDALGLWGDTTNDDDPGIVGLPKAVKLYKEDVNAQQRKRVSISKVPILTACQRMEAWRAQNPYKRTTARDWFYYQLYTLERYESFIETARGEPKDKSPAWYNSGVDELRKYQGSDGGWADNSHSRGPVATSFAILFLIRSTQRAIFSMGEGAARGGKGFGKDVRNAKLVGGQVKTEAIATEVSQMLDILEGDTDSLAGKSLPDDLKLAPRGVDREAQLDRLERLVRGSQSWQARRVAARLLGKSDEMRVVPALIYALSDPDKPVKRYARDGLRFISRKFEGFGMPDEPNESQVREAQKNWREWYLSMHPGYVFLDYDL